MWCAVLRSAPLWCAAQVDRFWWITASGAYGMHGEMLYECPYWSNSYGSYCGQVCDTAHTSLLPRVLLPADK